MLLFKEATGHVHKKYLVWGRDYLDSCTTWVYIHHMGVKLALVCATELEPEIATNTTVIASIL